MTFGSRDIVVAESVCVVFANDICCSTIDECLSQPIGTTQRTIDQSILFPSNNGPHSFLHHISFHNSSKMNA